MAYIENIFTHDVCIVYAYIFSDNSIYIGLTINPVSRASAHRNKRGSVFYKIQQRIAYEYVVLEDKISNLDLADKEVAYIAKYRADSGFNVMNKSNGGGRGSLKRVSNEYLLRYAKLRD